MTMYLRWSAVCALMPEVQQSQPGHYVCQRPKLFIFIQLPKPGFAAAVSLRLTLSLTSPMNYFPVPPTNKRGGKTVLCPSTFHTNHIGSQHTPREEFKTFPSSLPFHEGQMRSRHDQVPLTQINKLFTHHRVPSHSITCCV